MYIYIYIYIYNGVYIYICYVLLCSIIYRPIYKAFIYPSIRGFLALSIRASPASGGPPCCRKSWSNAKTKVQGLGFATEPLGSHKIILGHDGPWNT